MQLQPEDAFKMRNYLRCDATFVINGLYPKGIALLTKYVRWKVRRVESVIYTAVKGVKIGVALIKNTVFYPCTRLNFIIVNHIKFGETKYLKERIMFVNIVEKATDTHHIIPRSVCRLFELDPDLGIACCEDCHYNKGHRDECSLNSLKRLDK